MFSKECPSFEKRKRDHPYRLSPSSEAVRLSVGHATALQASAERGDAAIPGRGQSALEKLEGDVEGKPAGRGIVAGAFVTGKSVGAVDLMPLEVRPGLS